MVDLKEKDSINYIKENIDENEILQTLRPLLIQYGKEKLPDEHFGDFVIRTGW